MSNASDFIIENGVLTKYVGSEANVIIPEGVTEITQLAFFNCESPVTITVPDSVTSVSNYAFCGCDNLTFIDSPSGLHIKMEGYFDDKEELSILYLLSNAFADETLEKECKQYIQKHFEDCADYVIECASVHMLNRLLSVYSKKPPVSRIEKLINISAAADKSDLTGFLLEYKNKNYECKEKAPAKTNDLTDDELTTEDWRKLFKFTLSHGTARLSNYVGKDTTVVIPSKINDFTVNGIDELTFCGKNKIEHLILSEGISYIDRAFMECKSLKTVSIPKSVTSISAEAFADCPKLAEFIVSEENELFSAVGGNLYNKSGEVLIKWAPGNKSKSIEIPSGIKCIEESAFSFNVNLAHVALPEGLTTISKWAFEGCEKLTTITIPNSVTNIGDRAFVDCDSLTIHAPAGSYAETYAKENNIPFVAE